jgi:hypothetical protein
LDSQPRFRSDFLFEITAYLKPPPTLASISRGERKAVYTIGGRIQGPQIQAKILSGGADWFLLRPDGVGELAVRVLAHLEDRTVLSITCSGYFVASEDVWARIFARETVASSEYSYRVALRFETRHERYSWLTSTVAVGTGRVGPGWSWVSYSAYGIV